MSPGGENEKGSTLYIGLKIYLCILFFCAVLLCMYMVDG